MEEQRSESHQSWWGAAWRAILALAGACGIAAGIAPLFSGAMRDWYQGHGLLGWSLVGVCLVVAVAVAGVLQDKLVRARSDRDRAVEEARGNEDSDRPRRQAEIGADIKLVEKLLGPFLTHGTLRGDLESLHDKYFSRAMAYVFEDLDDYFTKGHERIYDAKLRAALDGVRTAMAAYWGKFQHHLDAHPDIEDRRWNLQILRPPGGTWEGSTSTQRWDDFYNFVRSLGPLRLEFIKSLRPVEARLYEMRVEMDPAEEPDSPEPHLED